MIRGTTAAFKFKLPYQKGKLAWATIQFWQPSNFNPNLPITKTLTHCKGDDDAMELCVALTAEETRWFSEKYKALVQMRAQVEGGSVFGCRPQYVTVYPMLDEILDIDPVLPTEEDDESLYIIDGGSITT